MKKEVRVRLETKTCQAFDGLAFLFQQVFQDLFVAVDLVVNLPKIFLVSRIVVVSQKGSTGSQRNTQKGLNLSKQ
jgi:hypothetical protein